MLPGDVCTFKGGRAIAATFGIWAAKNGKWIRIHMTGDGINFSNTSVYNNLGSIRYHRTLFRNLRRLLIVYGKRPFGEEGSEMED